MANRRLLLLAAILLMANTGRSAKPAPQRATKPTATDSSPKLAKKLSAEDQLWVAQTLKKMTLDEKLGQVMLIFYYGGFISTESAPYKDLLRLVEESHIGGLVVQTRGSPLGVERSQAYPTAVLANELQRHAKIPLLIGADFERGTSMRLDEGTSFPQAMALGAAGSPQDAYTMGRVTAIEARAVGVQWVFAPVADVNINPENPIINIRSFGEDPLKVSEYVAAFVRGVEENGALATAKHFPGHGDTSTDSHLDLPKVSGDLARLERVELPPFRAAIAAGVSTIMTGHLAVAALEPDPDIPATLSPRILTGLLRKQMGFQGLVVTDAMDMAGVTSRYPPGEAAVRAIAAGADMLLVPPVPPAAFEALRDAVKSGRIPMSRLNEAVTRVLRAKARLKLYKNKLVNLEALNTKFGKPEFAAAALDIADRGISLLRDADHLLPLDATKPTRALLLAVAGDPDPYPGEDFERELRWRVDTLTSVRTDTRFVRAANVKLPPPESYDVAIAALFVRVADRKGTVMLPDDQAALVEQLLSSGKPVVLVAFGNPYLIERFPSAKTWLAAFSSVDIAQVAAARALFGQVPIQGHLPVSVPGAQPPLNIGDGLSVAANPMTLGAPSSRGEERLKPAFDLLDRAVADRAFPGGVLAVGYKDELTMHAFGRMSLDAAAGQVSLKTIYDVASLTKPVVTTTLVELQVTANRLNLDSPLSVYLPEWLSGPNLDWRKKVTVRHLLTHTSGLPAHKDYFLEVKNKREMLAKIFAEPLEYEPGTKSVYSDLGFILLGEIIERLTGRTIDDLARERIFTPLKMQDSMFNPPKSLLTRIAPTENDTTYRKRLIRGVVDDENAYAMGGVAGNAGLFSTAPDLAAFCQTLLNGGIYAHQRLLRRGLIDQFTAKQTLGGGTRALGWTVPTEDSSSGHYLSSHSYGHTGFTGTSIWIDPDKQLFVILLTNRVNPTRENDKIQQVRPALHDAIVEALGLVPPSQPQN